MEKQVIIRLAEEKDINRILELYRELAITTSYIEQNRKPSSDDYEQTFNLINYIPGHNLLVAEYQGNVVGTIVLLIVPNLAHSACPWAMVENVIVDNNYRGQQIGRLLIEYAINRAKEAGCYKLMLTSNKKRREAHWFYRSLGFEATAHGFSMYF